MAGRTKAEWAEEQGMKNVLYACAAVIVCVPAAWGLRAEAFEPPEPEIARIALTEKPTDADRKVLKQLQETKVTFTFNEQPVLEALDFFSTLGQINIVPDRKILKDPAPEVTLKLTDVTLETAVSMVAEQLGLKAIIRDGVVFISDAEGVKKAAAAETRTGLTEKPTEADRKVLKRLQETIVSFTFNEQPVMEALDFLQTLGTTNVVPDHSKFVAADEKVTLKLKDVPLDVAIKLLVEQLGLTYVIRDGVVLVTDEAGVKRAAAADARTGLAEKPTDADRKLLKRLQETKVSFTFNEQPVKGALDFLAAEGNINIVADEKVFGKRRHEVTVRHYDPLMEIFIELPADVVREGELVVTLKVKDVTLETAIKLLVEQIGLAYVIRDGAVLVTDEKGIAETPVTVVVGEEGVRIVKALEEKKVSFDFQEQTLQDAVEFLETKSGANILADPRAKAGGKPASDAKVTLRLVDASAWDAVRQLATTTGLNVIVSEQAVLLTDLRELTPARAAAPGEVAKAFDETPVSFEFKKMKLGEAMEFLRKVSPVRFGRVVIGAEERERPVTLKVRMISLRNALNWTTRFSGTTWAVRDNLIVITDEKPEK